MFIPLSKRSTIVTAHDKSLNKNYLPVEIDYFDLRSGGGYSLINDILQDEFSYTYCGQEERKVLMIWKGLIEESAKLDLSKLAPKVHGIPHIRRFKLPQPEVGVVNIWKKFYKQYSWLPEELDITPSKIRKHDRDISRSYSKAKHLSHSINKRWFCGALRDVLKIVNDNASFDITEFDEYIGGLNKSSNACYPYYTRKDDPKTQRSVYEWMEETLSRRSSALGRLFSIPVTLFHRFSPKVRDKLKKVEVKIRVVHGYSMNILCLQETFFGKIIDSVLKANVFLFGKTRLQLSGIASWIRDYLENLNLKGITLDIMGMDHSLGADSMLLVHAILEHVIWTQDREVAEINKEILDALAMYEIHGPLMGTWDGITMCNGGTKSGTRLNTFTNSIVNLLSSSYHFRSRGELMLIYLVRGLSDDWVIPVRPDQTIEDLKANYRLFNLRIHGDKSFKFGHDEPFDMMGMTWSLNNEPTRPYSWMIGKTAYPERFVDADFLFRFIVRATSILGQIANGLEVYKFIMSQTVGFMKNAIRDKQLLKIPFYNKRDGPEITTTIDLPTLLTIGWKYF